MRIHSFGVVALLLFLPMGVTSSSAHTAVTMDPKVQQVLSSCSLYYASLTSFEADIASATKIGMNGMKQEMDSSFHLALARPDSFALIKTSGMMGGSIMSDGKNWITYQPILHKYTSTDSPDLSDLIQPMNLILASGPVGMGIEPLLTADTIKIFGTDLTGSSYVGLEKMGAVAVDHVRVVSTASTTDLWIAEGPAPFILQSETNLNIQENVKALSDAEKKKLAAGIAGMTMVRTNTFTNWKTNETIASTTFQFKPPADAQLVEDNVPQPVSSLVGKAAPDFQLNDLDGKAVSLASLRGKIVVLDFWATWCGPCRASLPILSAVTSTYKDKGVAFYAMNIREDAGQIRKFQSSQKLSFSVLLDATGSVANLYQAHGIPETVVVDKEGKIQAVHVGYSPSLRKTLTTQLNDVLAGKQLAVAAAPVPAPALSASPHP